MPTPRLPSRALELLAACPTPREVAAQLVLLGHPDAPALASLCAQAQPDLFELERVLSSSRATRLRAAARRGDANLRAFAARQLDLGNLEAALSLAGTPRDVPPERCWLEGGALLGREAFVAAAQAPSPEDAARALAPPLVRTPLAPLARAGLLPASTLEARALGLELGLQLSAARREPLGSATLLSYVLALRAFCLDVARVVWGRALGAAPETVTGRWVTPWD